MSKAFQHKVSESVMQFGMRPDAMGYIEYTCLGGPADGLPLRLVAGDVIVIGKQPPGVNEGDPFIAVSCSLGAAASMRTLSTYRGEYHLRDGVLSWTVGAPAPSHEH